MNRPILGYIYDPLVEDAVISINASTHLLDSVCAVKGLRMNQRIRVGFAGWCIAGLLVVWAARAEVFTEGNYTYTTNTSGEAIVTAFSPA